MIRQLLPAAALFLLALAACDRDTRETTVVAHRLVTVTETEAMRLPGEKMDATVDTTTLWLGPGLARRDKGRRSSLLVDAHRELITNVDHETRTWTRQTRTEMAAQLDALARDTVGSDDRRTRQLQRLLDMKARVIDTGETDTVDGYPVRRWIVEQSFGGQRITSELWLTEAIDVDYDLMLRTTQAPLLALPGGAEVLTELGKLRGVTVRSSAVLEVFGRTSSTNARLVAADLDTVPVSFFAPPGDYAPADVESQ
jgi:hypothetical protein